MNAIFYIVILIMSIVIHEVCHGFMAKRFGDNTALYAGRLTLNPIPHLDIFGSIILPIILYISHTPFLFGWAKPVPYNPENLTDKKWGTIAVAAAGVLANFGIAIIFGLSIRFLPIVFPVLSFSEPFYFITSTIVIVNLALGLFNLVPIPPLDGSKIILNLLPSYFDKFRDLVEQYGFILLLIFIVYFSDILSPILRYLFSIVTGLAI
jgi:Zn-dependent protease